MIVKEGSTYNNNSRRLFHFVSISVVSLLYGLSSLTTAILPIVSILATIFISLDLLRLQWEPLNRKAQEWFSWIMRKHEACSISGTSWFLIALVFALSLFTKPVLVFSFLVLAVGDPIASYVGIASTQGKKLGTKTWAGAGAFFLATTLVGGLWLLQTLPPLLAFGCSLLGGAGAAVSEKLVSQMDDNLFIPLVAGGLATLVLNLTTLMV